MPTYPFECCKCGDIEDVLCHIDERDNYKICPKCGGERIQLICSPKMITIHDVVGKGDLYHRRTIIGNKVVATTDGYGSRYYYKNNPGESPLLLKRQMESDLKKKKD